MRYDGVEKSVDQRPVATRVMVAVHFTRTQTRERVVASPPVPSLSCLAVGGDYLLLFIAALAGFYGAHVFQ